MGVYAERILPRLIDRACGSQSLAPWRIRALTGLRGRVLEIGFGSGHNLAHLPGEVVEVLAVEPSSLAWRRSARRRRRCRVPVRLVGLDGQRIDLPDGSCDAALSTFTLCTVEDPGRALGEIRRVLRPGGRLHLLEHGLARDPAVSTWQRRLDPWERRLAGGCHLTRDPIAMLHQAGFEVGDLDQGYAPGPRPWMWLTVGTATLDGHGGAEPGPAGS